MDRHTRQQRSKNMAAVKSRGNKSTEGAFLIALRANKITGWRRNNKKVYGNPDFVFTKKKIAIFLDGCFWHGCKRHKNIPKTNFKFWKEKISLNIKRDKKVSRELKKQGWMVFRFWEHEIKKNSKKSVGKIIKYLK